MQDFICGCMPFMELTPIVLAIAIPIFIISYFYEKYKEKE